VFVAERLAAHALRARATAVPPAVRHHAKRALIDWHAAVYPGLHTAPLGALLKVLADELDRGPARLPNGRPATSRAAALIQGAAAHAAEVDDSFRDAMYHPGAATIAAALATAHAQGASGETLLRAVVAGYEISTRIGVTMGRAHYRHWHSTGTIGTLGAAAAAAEAMRLDARAFAHALATAATFAAGLQQAFRLDSMSKPLHAGRAAEAGVLAAQVAAAGATGALDIFEGEVGFGRALGEDPDWSRVDETLGQDFHITRLTFKNHVGCGHAFPAVDGALALRQREGLEPEQIEQLQVYTYQPALDIACHLRPQSAHEAQFSLTYMVASALVHGSVRMAAFEPARLHCARTRSLMERIHVGLDPKLDAGFPRMRAARLELTLKVGRRCTHLQPTRKGDPEDPLADGDLDDKLLELAAPVIGPERARRLLGELWTLDTRPHAQLLLDAQPEALHTP
jgi:2-methylcitrate dehydratase PrpD